MNFKIKSDWPPAGDQPKAIKKIVAGYKKGLKHQTLLGVTGSGKTFTMANVIAEINRPTLVIAHNKTLAAQLAQEYKDFFPENEVHYFVSYYDYYQPEAYIAHSDTYIEKEAMINEEIERLRHASTQALLTRRDVIIVASVSCIYGLGSPEEYKKVNKEFKVGSDCNREKILTDLVEIHFERTNADLTPGTFRVTGGAIEIMPVNEKIIFRLTIEKEKLINIEVIDAISRVIKKNEKSVILFPAKHYITPPETRMKVIKQIERDLEKRLEELKMDGKNLEAERLKRRTKYDLALIKEVGYCNGIENYSRYFDGRCEGEPPYTLLDYFPKDKNGNPDFITIIDESHVTIPQIGGMNAGDASRKTNLVEYGFRLPSAKDNRPLKFNEFEKRIGQCIYTSATPSKYEYENSEQIVEQVIRPTGLVDPKIEVKPIVSKGVYKGQIFDFINEAEMVIKNHERVIATTLTKKMAEDLSEFLKERNIKAEYLHSDIKTIDRIMILTEFRRGKFDCLVGVNLLREGLDLPEVAMIGILDADKEGFLRSETSLIQTIGRAARNINGRVILYADTITQSMKRSIDETNRRREIQIKYNADNGITPKTIYKKIHDITDSLEREKIKTIDSMVKIDLSVGGRSISKLIKEKIKQMNEAVAMLDFETAALLRDEIKEIEKYKKKK
jgi:excinuclease ABC subunit B